jgi:hypothetical protein
MTGWEIQDLLGELKAAIKGESDQAERFNQAYILSAIAPSCMIVVRQFEVVRWQDERRIMNAEPTPNGERQWGMTVIKHDGTAGSMYSVCLPNHLHYQSVSLNDEGQITLRAEEQTVETNVTEVQRKLKAIYGIATETEILAAFDGLVNEQYVPPKKRNVERQTIEHDLLGTICYDREREQYRAVFAINDRPVDIFIEWVESAALLPLFDEIGKKLSNQYYLQAMQAMLIPMLTLKNDGWLTVDKDGNEESPLTIAELQRKIEIREIMFYAGGGSVIYCDAGEVFLGHEVVVDVDKDGEFMDAMIGG